MLSSIIYKQEIATFFLMMILLQSIKFKLKKREKKKESFFYRQFVIFILAVYFTGVCHYTLLHRDVTIEMNYELSLFWSYRYVLVNNSKEIFLEIAYNILLLLPMGVLLPFYLKLFRQFRYVILAGFLLSVLIETSQLIFHIGLFEFDDLFHNTLGACIGYSLYDISLWLRKNTKEQKKIGKLAVLMAIDIIVVIYFERLWSIIN